MDWVDVNIVATLPTPTPTATLTLPNMSIDIDIAGRLYNLWNHTQITTPMPSLTSTPHPWIARITYSIRESIVFLKKDIKWAISATIAFLILVVALANFCMQHRKKKKGVPS